MWEGNRHNTGLSHQEDELKTYCRDVLDFPRKGIIFRDITNLLKDKYAFRKMIDKMSARFINAEVDIVVSIEARGFILGSALAYNLGAGFVPVRKEGKLPWNKICEQYSLEYGNDTLEIHQDAIEAGQKVLLIDDVLATGGTARAVANMIKQLKGDLVCGAFLIELLELEGRQKLEGIPVYSLMQF